MRAQCNYQRDLPLREFIQRSAQEEEDDKEEDERKDPDDRNQGTYITDIGEQCSLAFRIEFDFTNFGKLNIQEDGKKLSP